MARKKKTKNTAELVMKVNGSPLPFSRVQFCQNLPVEYDPKLDIYKGEIIIHPAPSVYPMIDFHPDGTLKLAYGTEVDFEFGDDCLIRGKVLNLRGKLRLIEVGIKLGDVMQETPPTKSKAPDNPEEVESFARELEIVETVEGMV